MYHSQDILVFVMYYVYVTFGPSLLTSIESINSMIGNKFELTNRGGIDNYSIEGTTKLIHAGFLLLMYIIIAPYHGAG